MGYYHIMGYFILSGDEEIIHIHTYMHEEKCLFINKLRKIT